MKNGSYKIIWIILPIVLFFLFSCVKGAAFYARRGNDYANKGQYDEAISNYNKALEINPSDPLAYNNLAWLFATADVPRFRNGEEALKLGTKSVRAYGLEKPNPFRHSCSSLCKSRRLC